MRWKRGSPPDAPGFIAARRRFIAGGTALAGLCLLDLTGCGRKQPQREESFVFGTRVEVQVWDQPAAAAREALAAVLREFDRLHHLLHAWQPSALFEVNQAIGAGRAAQCPEEVGNLLAAAQDLARRGDYLFDPGIGRLIALWGFQADEFKAALPHPAELARLVRIHPSIADISISPERTRVSSSKADVALDLGGYAKGYALDRAASILRAAGVRDALVNIGGNIFALGSKSGQPWRVGVQHPRRPQPLASLDLGDGEAIGTSGDYQRYFELNGRRYCHLIDPRDGMPVMHTQALTVLVTPRAAAGALSDGASKPLFVAGRTGWRDMARRLEIDHALRVDADGSIQVTRALAARLRWEGEVPPMEQLA
ncbi:MAG: FAD:protein FMN transferase [Rhodocyclaceae bacterium]|nr:FAD:protein FMN transferase [Rhodocyclaceae bacterium]MBX3670815.1 FAD:protein FMN transferase [Rhodocyclaceae bacterium]